MVPQPAHGLHNQKLLPDAIQAIRASLSLETNGDFWPLESAAPITRRPLNWGRRSS
jgi:hypothetical protein